MARVAYSSSAHRGSAAPALALAPTLALALTLAVQERANYHARKLDEAAAKREHDQRATRARLQGETLDVLSIQVR